MGLWIVTAPISFAGILAFIVGLVITTPIVYLSTARVYRLLQKRGEPLSDLASAFTSP